MLYGESIHDTLDLKTFQSFTKRNSEDTVHGAIYRNMFGKVLLVGCNHLMFINQQFDITGKSLRSNDCVEFSRESEFICLTVRQPRREVVPEVEFV